MPVTHRGHEEAFQKGSDMSTRTRKLVGTVVMVVFIFTYALFAMAVAEGRITSAPKPVQTIAYIVLGLIWVLPMMPLIRWMARPDKP
jgi:predicted membrane channel-forming protein YqfA (hemolysin III family)